MVELSWHPKCPPVAPKTPLLMRTSSRQGHARGVGKLQAVCPLTWCRHVGVLLPGSIALWRCRRQGVRRLRRRAHARVAEPLGHADFWDAPRQRCEFTSHRARHVGPWAGTERIGTAPKPWSSDPFQFSQLRALLTPEEVGRILASAKQSDAYETLLDTVDDLPTFEFYPLRNGEWADPEMQAALGPIIEDRILPYVRERYSCPSCAVGDVLVRRYLPGERRTHAMHFDSNAFATAVVGLSDPDDYEGGLFLQPGPHASSRQYPRLEVGDVLVHSYDLQHGVHVHSGTRYSLILWLKTSPGAAASDTMPWLDGLAASGDPHALHLKACLALEQDDFDCAFGSYKRSARAGHHWAQHSLATLYDLMAEDAPTEYMQALFRKQAAKWWRRAADAGLAEAQRNLAICYMDGTGVDCDPERAASWMELAAEQLDVLAAHAMGEFFSDGVSCDADEAMARHWFERSAAAGYEPSARALRKLSSRRRLGRVRRRLAKFLGRTSSVREAV